ncbi:hypothetical protein BKA65DRAFT_492607 [Rhexocercosporidium sp. MPI-PUGE-AT-0058]|nr:hypothetical protein BKA65DRAFT_492607 [Rhexocercosporidium sp. MPI-PUGE-AT-0058]
MAAGHVPPYQTPYSSSPYGGNVPTSTAANLPPNFMPPTSGAPSFPMNSMNMNPQHQAQRMQPPPPSSTPTQPGPRASPFAGIPHNTPPNAGPQSQFSPPQQPNPAHLQTPNNNQQIPAGNILTPQTPNFPPGPQGPNASQAMATPLSPGSESREKERVTLLLDINRELLMEVMKIQAAQVEAKKEETAPGATSPEGGGKEKTEQEKAEKEKAEKEKVEKAKPSSREYVECMRRLQSNLAYLAAIADRSHKPSSQIPPHPAIMTAPMVTPKPALVPASSPKSDSKDSDEKKSDDKKVEEEENRTEILKEQYKKLQALFPGVDPKKEPQMQGVNPAMRAQAQQHAAAQMQAQKQQQQQQGQGHNQGQGQGQTQDPNSQQKLQNDLLRQKMMMQQQAQQNAQQQMAQNMQNMNHQGLGQNR